MRLHPSVASSNRVRVIIYCSGVDTGLYRSPSLEKCWYSRESTTASLVVALAPAPRISTTCCNLEVESILAEDVRLPQPRCKLSHRSSIKAAGG